MTKIGEWLETAPVPRWGVARRVAAPAAALLRGKDTSLVPPSTISARSLVIVITIMSFLASMAAGGAVIVGRASKQWSSSVAQEASIQIRAKPGLDLDAEAARVAGLIRGRTGVSNVHVFSRAESERLLEPWLGQDLNFDDLPVPRLIVVTLDQTVAGVAEDLRQTLAKDAPNASFDDHRGWSERLSTMGRTLVLVAVMVLALILIAMALAVAFATSGAMAGSREIVDVLHIVGATDAYICRQYERRFFLFGLQGGVFGALAACTTFVIAGNISRAWIATASGGQVEALFGSFTLGALGYACIAGVTLFTAIIVTATSHVIVSRQLDTLA